MWPTAKEITRKGRSVKSMCVNGNYVCQTGWVWRLWLSLMPSGVHLCERSHLRTSPALPSKVELSHWICPDSENKSRPLSPYLSPWHPAISNRSNSVVHRDPRSSLCNRNLSSPDLHVPLFLILPDLPSQPARLHLQPTLAPSPSL